MKVVHYTDIEAEEADEGAFKVKVRWVISKEMGAPNFAMRVFEIETGGYSPLHSHSWEHEVFILEGEGVAVGQDGEKKFRPGDAVFVAPNEKHQFRNTGKKLVRFICVVPHVKK
jgi:quercetin dioxygenase-like cupin family protein